MILTDILLSQIVDPFRIGMIVALVATMSRTRAATGMLVPLAAGVLFVAVLIPTVMHQASGTLLWLSIGVGLVTNAMMVLIILGLWTAFRRYWRQS